MGGLSTAVVSSSPASTKRSSLLKSDMPRAFLVDGDVRYKALGRLLITDEPEPEAVVLRAARMGLERLRCWQPFQESGHQLPAE